MMAKVPPAVHRLHELLSVQQMHSTQWALTATLRTFVHEDAYVDEAQSFLLNGNFNSYMVFQRAEPDLGIQQEVLQTPTEEACSREPGDDIKSTSQPNHTATVRQCLGDIMSS